jgi:hypothetical protein
MNAMRGQKRLHKISGGLWEISLQLTALVQITKGLSGEGGSGNHRIRHQNYLILAKSL